MPNFSSRNETTEDGQAIHVGAVHNKIESSKEMDDTMTHLKPPEELEFERERLKIEEEKVENIFKDKARLVDEQKRMKGTEPSRGRR